MFNTLLIANRGEIACRIAATARRMGIRTVAVYSDADAKSRHVAACDIAVHIGGSEPSQSYLNADLILEVAKQTGAQAIHPGYGFLAENEHFAKSCSDAGIVFVGPDYSSIAAMGSKSAAKSLMEKANVPLVPGYHGDNQDESFLKEQADAMGYPVLIKASAGGGGKGMRIVNSSDEFLESLISCKRESLSSFGDDKVLIEKYLIKPRHIEIQVFADTQGNIVYLFERDCSVQRRHQKVIEEGPAPGMTNERRQAMGEAAVAAAKAVNYVGAGTVEFIVEPDGSFYFMEMNTRLQVEHPVTELITGLDLVQWQLDVAAGKPLPLSQDQLSFSGHAIEARIYAENPDNDFLPSIGTLQVLNLPEHVSFENGDIRIDGGVQEGDTISPYYDPMIAKLIVKGENRDQARARMVQVLDQIQSVGVHTNISFLRRLMLDESFAKADLDTGLIQRQHQQLFPEYKAASSQTLALAVATILINQAHLNNLNNLDNNPWAINNFWRVSNTYSRSISLVENNQVTKLRLIKKDNKFQLIINELSHKFEWQGQVQNNGCVELQINLDSKILKATTVISGQYVHVYENGNVYVFDTIEPGLYGDSDGDTNQGGLNAPMPGKIISIEVNPGTKVKSGDNLLIMEAMKMEHTIHAPFNGTIEEVFFNIGDQVQDGDELISIKPEKP